jgi:predicted small secreted protein
VELWQILLGIAFLLVILTFVYLLISRKRRRENVVKILKEAKALKKEIEKEG